MVCKGYHICQYCYQSNYNTLLVSSLVIAKVFRQADTDETGNVEATRITELAASVLGSQIKDSEKQLIKYHSDLRAGVSK